MKGINISQSTLLLEEQHKKLLKGFGNVSKEESPSLSRPFKIFSLYDHTKYVNHTATSLTL